MGEKEGMRIIVNEVKRNDLWHPSLIIEVENTNEQAAIFMDEGISSRLHFKLIDQEGKEIKPDIAWASSANPKPEGIRRMHTEIPVGGRVGYYLDLAEAYEMRWVDGSKLMVSWEPGYREGGAPNVYGWGLKAEYDLTTLVRKIFPNGYVKESVDQNMEEDSTGLTKDYSVKPTVAANNSQLEKKHHVAFRIPLLVAGLAIGIFLILMLWYKRRETIQ